MWESVLLWENEDPSSEDQLVTVANKSFFQAVIYQRKRSGQNQKLVLFETKFVAVDSKKLSRKVVRLSCSSYYYSGDELFASTIFGIVLFWSISLTKKHLFPYWSPRFPYWPEPVFFCYLSLSLSLTILLFVCTICVPLGTHDLLLAHTLFLKIGKLLEKRLFVLSSHYSITQGAVPRENLVMLLHFSLLKHTHIFNFLVSIHLFGDVLCLHAQGVTVPESYFPWSLRWFRFLAHE